MSAKQGVSHGPANGLPSDWEPLYIYNAFRAGLLRQAFCPNDTSLFKFIPERNFFPVFEEGPTLPLLAYVAQICEYVK